MEPRFFVYIMTNDRQTVLYTGVTGNLVQRGFEHRTHALPGFSNRCNVDKLVFYEEASGPAAAIASGNADQGGIAQKEGRADRCDEIPIGGICTTICCTDPTGIASSLRSSQ